MQVFDSPQNSISNFVLRIQVNPDLPGPRLAPTANVYNLHVLLTFRMCHMSDMERMCNIGK